jgi:cation transporter-like permease
MDDAEFRSQLQQLPPGMRFVVGHVVGLSLGVIVLFGALLVAVLVVHTKASSVIAFFCIFAIVMALVNMAVFRTARRRMLRVRSDPED